MEPCIPLSEPPATLVFKAAPQTPGGYRNRANLRATEEEHPDELDFQGPGELNRTLVEKRADYSLSLFPEVKATNFLSENAPGTGPENEKRTVSESDNGPSLLTLPAKVRRVGEKLPE